MQTINITYVTNNLLFKFKIDFTTNSNSLFTKYDVVNTLLPLEKPIIGGNINYLGLMDILKHSNNLLQIDSVLFGIGDQNVWINNANNEYIVINEGVVVTPNQVYIVYNSSEDNVWEI